MTLEANAEAVLAASSRTSPVRRPVRSLPRPPSAFRRCAEHSQGWSRRALSGSRRQARGCWQKPHPRTYADAPVSVPSSAARTYWSGWTRPRSRPPCGSMSRCYGVTLPVIQADGQILETAGVVTLDLSRARGHQVVLTHTAVWRDPARGRALSESVDPARRGGRYGAEVLHNPLRLRLQLTLPLALVLVAGKPCPRPA